jgi:superfamily I DNA and RNA helicase
MNFYPNYPNDNNKGQRFVWQALKDAFKEGDGVAYYRYPIFAKHGSRLSEPDFLVVHRKYGVWIFESKGCQIGNIVAIQGHDWQMRDWYSTTMSPISQVEAQHWEVKHLVGKNKELQGIPIEWRVVLPFIQTDEWASSGYLNHPSTNGVVWLKEDLEKPRFLQKIQEASAGQMPQISDELWERLKGVFRGVVDDTPPRLPIPGTPPTNYSQIIHAVENRLKVLDEQQNRVSQEVPDGPQRIRGLAGTGKTILFARRVAQMHAHYPGWEIAFVFWSRSLYQQILALVESNFRRITGTGEAPNWDKLHIWHAWGSNQRTGFYRELSSKWNCPFLNVGQAELQAMQGESKFEAACRLLEQQSIGKQPIFDAIVIDEGQDLPASFYRVAHRSLKEPKRLYWAYDEAQGIDNLIVPSGAKIFGRDEAGRPVVDLKRFYTSGIRKARNLNRCYRTPRLVLTTAHAVNMGLLREGGPLQGVTHKYEWQNLGYNIIEGDFRSLGSTVVLERPESTSRHPIDCHEFEPGIDPSDVFDIKITANEEEDADFVANSILRDLESGLRPEDIAVVSLEPFSLLKKVDNELRTMGISTLFNDQNSFKKDGHVTLSYIRRAKGNEAYKVYVLNLHMADKHTANDENREMILRNQAFVALTRTKLWCVVVGRSCSIMDEITKVKNQGGVLRFPAFKQDKLRRSMADEEALQQELI